MSARSRSPSRLTDLEKLVARVEADLRARSAASDLPEIAARLEAEYARARAARRTAATLEEWRTDRITQAAVAWVLSCVFVRFLEDNDLIAPPRIAGPGERLGQARDFHEHYFTSHPRETDRDYLLAIFDELADLPGTADIFGPHNALREIPTWLSGDAAREIIQFFQKIDANTGLLIHDFTDPGWDTRFLGDLYQDLSAFARSRYALLQTPSFIEQFLLDRTLEPALDAFGLTEQFKMIDPACGSGHLLLGSFARILDRWQRAEPAAAVRELVRRTLASVHGVDINPFAVAIARFRLLLVAMRACDIVRLADAPAFHLNVECGDSLLHTPLAGGQAELFDKHALAAEQPARGRAKKAKPGDEDCEHAYASENLAALKKLLQHGQYHAVMANPPYITPKDPGLRDRYRDRFTTCHMKYSLAVPFMEHIFKLCVTGGFTGQITANSFMKREFGKHLIEKFFPTTDLTHVIDTSGAYIPGHGTPTVILFGRRRAPVADTVRAVMGIRGEPATPDDPARGLVWTAITEQLDQPGSQSEFVSVADTPRAFFHSHPWSIGGGGASELKERLDNTGTTQLRDHVTSIGIMCFTLADDVFFRPRETLRRSQIDKQFIRDIAVGDSLRDWQLIACETLVFPYDEGFRPVPIERFRDLFCVLWPHRTLLSRNKMFGGKTKVECGLGWHEYGRLTVNKLQAPRSIIFSNVSTHNHFVYDSQALLCECHAPLIKLPTTASDGEHLKLLGILNSSIACFWMKQVFYPKATASGDVSADKGKPEANRYEFAGTGLEALPIPASLNSAQFIGEIAAANDERRRRLADLLPAAALSRWSAADDRINLRTYLMEAESEYDLVHKQMVALQEELDWECYKAYGLCSDGASTEVIGIIKTDAMGVSPAARSHLWSTDAAPPGVPEAFRPVYETRRRQTLSNEALLVVETPVYKRPWWGRQGVYGRLARDYTGWQGEALQAFLLDRLERLFDFDGRMNDEATPTATLPSALVSLGGLATAAGRDPLFMEAAEVFTGDIAFDPLALVTSLVADESVPLLPVLCYKPSGMRKHGAWQEVWALQRREDAIDARTSLPSSDPLHLAPEQARDLKRREVGEIPVPPKYTSADFLRPAFWRLRGKLDVPKERFTSFPGILGQDGTLVIAWAGLDHLQLAKAIGDFYGLVQTEYGGSDDDRLIPLLANLSELIPWVEQWHPSPLPAYAGPPADFYTQFLRDESASRHLTPDQLRTWQPLPRQRRTASSKARAK